MREYFTYGSVRGAAGNGGPYRVRVSAKLQSVIFDLRSKVMAIQRLRQSSHGRMQYPG